MLKTLDGEDAPVASGRVSAGYEAQISQEDGKTVITNRHVPSEEHGPKTGEGNALLIWMMICLASLLTLFMVVRKEISVR